MPSRPPAQPIPSASSSQIIHPQTYETVRLLPLFAQLAFHVIPAKLDGELGKVYSWIEELGGRCVSAEEATFIVTALKGRARLEKLCSRDMLVCLRASQRADQGRTASGSCRRTLCT